MELTPPTEPTLENRVAKLEEELKVQAEIIAEIEQRPRLMYSRREAARALRLSESSLDLLIHRRTLKVIHKGRRIYIARAELERFAHNPAPQLWPAKRDGKTTRHFAPSAVSAKKPPAKASFEADYQQRAAG